MESPEYIPTLFTEDSPLQSAQDVPGKKPWDPPNKLRGRNYNDLAISFARKFPIKSTLTVEQFDEWAAQEHCYPGPVPLNAPKQSDAWKAHLQRRYELQSGLRKASTHPRLYDDGLQPYLIFNVS